MNDEAQLTAEKTNEADEKEKRLNSIIDDAFKEKDSKKVNDEQTDNKEKVNDKDDVSMKDSEGDEKIPPEDNDSVKDTDSGDDNSAVKSENTKDKEDSGKSSENDVENILKLFDDIDFKAIEDGDGMSLQDLKSFVNGVKTLRDTVVSIMDSVKEHGDFIERERCDRMENEFDDIFDDLSDEFGDVIGRGKIRTLDKVLQDNRNAVLRKASVLMKAYNESGERKSTKEVIKEASLLMFSDKISSTPKEVARTDRRSSFITKPNTPSGNSSFEDGDTRALALIEKALSK